METAFLVIWRFNYFELAMTKRMIFVLSTSTIITIHRKILKMESI